LSSENVFLLKVGFLLRKRQTVGSIQNWKELTH
jgi:hypothetical protein